MVMQYTFTRGIASPYDAMYDYIGNVGDPVIIASDVAINATGYGMQRHLIRTSDDTLYAVYGKPLAGIFQIYVKKSIDGGMTWTDEIRISTYSGMGSYHQRGACIAVDGNDYLHVVWSGRATGYTTHEQIWYVKYVTSWSTPIRISTYSDMSTTGEVAPVLAIDSNNYLHVVWYGRATGYPENQIWYSRYVTSWSYPLRLSTASGMSTTAQGQPCIAVDSLNRLHVVWYGFATGYTTAWQIWYRRYVTSWGAITRISTYSNMATNLSAQPCIIADSNNYLHVVWSGRATGFTVAVQVWYAFYDGTWHTPVRISTYTFMSSYPQAFPNVAVDSDDYVHVVWYGKATGYLDYDKVWYNYYDGTWHTPECLQPIGQNTYPTLSLYERVLVAVSPEGVIGLTFDLWTFKVSDMKWYKGGTPDPTGIPVRDIGVQLGFRYWDAEKGKWIKAGQEM